MVFFIFERLSVSISYPLRKELAAYVDWFNTLRIHLTLGYLSPVTYTKYSIANLYT
ncbi:MAG: IS3 family transposase [Breznakia sp.]